MAVNIGQTIGEAEYTTLRGGIVLVMGTPTGTGTGAAGYNQAITSSAVSPGDKITSAAWSALKTDIFKAYTHQIGTVLVDDAPTPVGGGITKATHDALETSVNFIKDAANRFRLAAGQATTTSARSKTATNWNGTIIHDVTFTWANANAAKAFFNAGGRLRIASTMSYTGTEAKTLDWKTMLSDTSVVAINYVSAYKETGTGGTISADDGYYDINGTERELYVRDGASPYSENKYRILARSITNGLRIRVLYEDNDVGDQTGLGAAVDENVQGTLTSALSYVYATGEVDVAAPTISTGDTNTFT